VMENLGAILTLFAALTTLSLLRVRFTRPALGRIPEVPLACAALYAPFAVWMLYFGFQGRSRLLPWLSAIVAAALIGYLATLRSRAKMASAPAAQLTKDGPRPQRRPAGS
jgi:hypothetical protein